MSASGIALQTSRRSTWLRSASLAALLSGSLASGALAIDVTNQAEFDAAIQQAITTGQPDTINVSSTTPITADSGLAWPGQAAPLNINFGAISAFNVGLGTTGTLTIGDGTNLAFQHSTVITSWSVGRNAGGNGTVNMTGGTVSSVTTGSNYLSVNVGREAGSTGTFNQSGGSVDVAGGALQIGVASGQGTYNLSDAATLSLSPSAGTMYLGDDVGGVGVLNISGNASLVGGIQMYIGNAGGTGTINHPRPFPA
jgi:hypothetical protein